MTTLALAARTPRSRALGILVCVGALALSAQLAIPLPGTPVPLTFQPFVVVLAGLLLGPLDAAGAMVAYLVLGALGAPVFAPMGPPGTRAAALADRRLPHRVSARRRRHGMARRASGRGSRSARSRRSPAFS